MATDLNPVLNKVSKETPNDNPLLWWIISSSLSIVRRLLITIIIVPYFVFTVIFIGDISNIFGIDFYNLFFKIFTYPSTFFGDPNNIYHINQDNISSIIAPWFIILAIVSYLIEKILKRRIAPTMKGKIILAVLLPVVFWFLIYLFNFGDKNALFISSMFGGMTAVSGFFVASLTNMIDNFLSKRGAEFW